MRKIHLFTLLLTCLSLHAAEVEVGDWTRAIDKPSVWIAGPVKNTPFAVYSHLRGEGKFRISFKTENGTTQQEVTIPSFGWITVISTVPLASTTVAVMPVGEADGGPASIMVEPLDGAKFDGMFATTDPNYIAAFRNQDAVIYFRIRNNGDKVLRASVGVIRTMGAGVNIGYGSPTGFDAKTGELKPGEATVVAAFPQEVRERCTMAFSFLDSVNADIEFYADADGKKPLKAIKVVGAKPCKEYCFMVPAVDGSFSLLTLQDMFQQNIDALAKASLTGPVPQKIWFIAASIQNRDQPNYDTLHTEIKMARAIGLNGNFILDELESDRAAMGATYGLFSAPFYANAPDFHFTPQIEAIIRKNADAVKNIAIPTLVNGADEPRFTELPKTPAVDATFVEWMKKRNLTPQDAGVGAWEQVKCIAPNISQKRLSTLSRQFQMDEQINFWDSSMKIFTELNPHLLSKVNWSCFEYYTGNTIDLWELYRRPGLGVVWGEDWLEIEPGGAGITAWYAEQMRSQAKYRNIPIGDYPIFGFDGVSAPSRDLFKFYERLMRGNTIFFLYPYSPIGGEIGWICNPKNAVGAAKIARELALAENVVVGGKVQPAHAAIVYPSSCILWDRTAYEKCAALYLAYLHAGIPLDVITEQDLIDGMGKDYQMLFVVGTDMRKETLSALDGYVDKGGTLVSSVPEVRNEFDEPVTSGAKVFGIAGLQSVKNDALRGGIGNAGAIVPLDKVIWNGKTIEVICQKSKITPEAETEILATFSDGSPALVKTKKGQGVVYQYGLAPGLSYMRATYEHNLRDIFPTILAQNATQREFATLPATTLPSTVKVSDTMISGRVTVNKDASAVGLVDYGLGNLGRKHPNPLSTDVDLDTIEPYPVTVEIACRNKPESVTGVRSGNLISEFANGKLTVKVPLRGVEMILLKGNDLF
ncbi:MAG: hypothetical protein ABI443_00515 [Chthoniobacterales bacterium]